MHLHFVFPKWRKLLEGHWGSGAARNEANIGHFQMAGLGIPTAAAALPPGHTVTLHDENLRPVDFAVRPDAVGLSFFTPQASNAYAIADEFRRRGVPVIAGGIHPTMAPDDTLAHCDAVVRGPVETVWPELLADLERGRLQRQYTGPADAPFVQPRREVFSDSTYLKADIVQTARGCPLACSFCVVPGCYGRQLHFKPVAEVLDDIRRLSNACYFLADENLWFADATNRAYRQELLRGLIEAKSSKLFFLAAYPFMLRDLAADELEWLHRAGGRQVYLILGLQQPLREELADATLVRQVLALKAAGIEAMTTFTIGHDDDPPGLTPAITQFCERIQTNLAEFTIYTPFPGTGVFQRFEGEGRILTRDWSRYNGAHVVFQPRQQTPDELQHEYFSLWRTFYGRLSAFNRNQRYTRGFGREIFREK